VKSFFKNLFSGNAEKDHEPNLVFGRHSDFYKVKSKYQDWDNALEKHNKAQYQDAILDFLSYIKEEENVIVERVGEEKIRFSIFQGSKKIEGFANQDGFFAEAKIAKCDHISLGALRNLLEENYHLKYSSYALDSEENITIVMHSDYIDASPYKLYYGLKEIATRSDRRDDVLITKFKDLSVIENGLISSIPDVEKEIKFDYLKELIDTTIEEVLQDLIRLKEHPGLIAYRILSTAFKIDYFLKPEGVLMEHIENIHKTFFHINTLSPEQKNHEMLMELKKIRKLSKEAVFTELYNTKNTFGVLMSGSHLRLTEMIDQDMKHFDWYITNGFGDYAIYIPQYISSLLLYSYSMPLPDKNLLHLLLRIWNNDFFVKLGFKSLINDDKLEKAAIISKINEASKDKLEIYEEVNIDTSQINFSNLYHFSKTYLNSMYQLTIKKKD
jgi:hypothetical protein